MSATAKANTPKPKAQGVRQRPRRNTATRPPESASGRDDTVDQRPVTDENVSVDNRSHGAQRSNPVDHRPSAAVAHQPAEEGQHQREPVRPFSLGELSVAERRQLEQEIHAEQVGDRDAIQTAAEREASARDLRIAKRLGATRHADGCPTIESEVTEDAQTFRVREDGLNIEAYPVNIEARPSKGIVASEATQVRCRTCGGTLLISQPYSEFLADVAA